jgi:hypothetical protein
MKAYAMLLGMVLTLGSGYAAEVAVSSVGAGTGLVKVGTPTGAVRHGRDTIWYGGVLDPITVEAPGGGAATAPAARRMLVDPPVSPCSQRSPAYRAVL